MRSEVYILFDLLHAVPFFYSSNRIDFPSSREILHSFAWIFYSHKFKHSLTLLALEAACIALPIPILQFILVLLVLF
jgi:hypothetical protein